MVCMEGGRPRIVLGENSGGLCPGICVWRIQPVVGTMVVAMLGFWVIPFTYNLGWMVSQRMFRVRYS